MNIKFMENLSTRITYIYGLYEVGKEDDIRYVGKSNNPIDRIRTHKCDKGITPKTSWIKSVINNGGKIGFKILKVVDYNIWQEEEIKTIQGYNTNNTLKNYDKGGNGGKIKYTKSYQECIEWLKINKPDWVLDNRDYGKWSKQDDFPSFLPIAPHRVYTDFKWSKFLSNINNDTDRHLSYSDAKKWIRENYNFKSSTEYRKSKLPYFLPKKPFNTYKNEWVSWSEFLGFKPFTRDKNTIYLSYEDAKKWVRENFKKLSSVDFRRMSKNNEIPDFIPKKPSIFYKNDGFDNYDFFISNRKNRDYYYPYDECKIIVSEIVKKYNILTSRDWKKWCKTKSIEYKKVPSIPNKFYKNEWVSWYDWLGKI